MPFVPFPRGLIAPGLVLLLLSSGISSVARADDDEDEAAIQEVFLGELVFPQEAGEVQATLALAHDDENTSAGLAVEWGWTDSWQLELELDGVLDGDRTGLGRVEIGGRHSTLDLGSGFHLAAGLALAFTPEALDSERRRNALDLEPTLIVARDFTDGLHGFVQLGLEWNLDEGDPSRSLADEDEPEDALEMVLGGYAATPWGGWTLEVAFERELEDAEETESVAALGVVAKLGDGWELGAAGFVGLSDGAEDGFLLTLTVER